MRFLIIAILIVPIFAACASKEERLEQQIEKVEKIKNNFDLQRGSKLFYTVDSLSSTFTYFIDTDGIAVINEELFVSDRGQSFNLHYFDNDKLIYIEMQQMFYIPKEIGFDKENSDIAVYFEGDGDVLDYRKIVNRASKEMSTKELDEIYNHSMKLFSLSKENLKQIKK